MYTNLVAVPVWRRLGLAVGVATLLIVTSLSSVLADEVKPAAPAHPDSLVAAATSTPGAVTEPSAQIQVPNPFARVIDDPIKWVT